MTGTKYSPLAKHLSKQYREFVPMTFEEIERILGFSLPPSARKHRPWWSNNPRNSVMTKAWLSAGYRSQDVDIGRETLVFKRSSKAPEAPGGADGPHPVLGALRGQVQLGKDVDLTEPIDADWEAGRT